MCHDLRLRWLDTDCRNDSRRECDWRGVLKGIPLVRDSCWFPEPTGRTDGATMVQTSALRLDSIILPLDAPPSYVALYLYNNPSDRLLFFAAK